MIENAAVYFETYLYFNRFFTFYIKPNLYFNAKESMEEVNCNKSIAMKELIPFSSKDSNLFLFKYCTYFDLNDASSTKSYVYWCSNNLRI